MTNTIHYTRDRSQRKAFIEAHIGYGKPIQIEIVDKGHKNGKEFHVLTSTGIIEVYNYFTHKHITDMVARPGQIKREFDDYPAEVLHRARFNVSMGYNYV